MKRVLIIVLLGIIVTALTGCGRPKATNRPVPLTPIVLPGGQTNVTPIITDQNEPTGAETGNTPTLYKPDLQAEIFLPTEDNVKVLGRTEMIDDVRWCGWSGSGIEFVFAGKSCKVTLRGDELYDSDEHSARVAVYVNGERVKDFRMTDGDGPEMQIPILESDEFTAATIGIVKLSEVSDSTVGIVSIEAIGMITPLNDKAKHIEFIGDSITCGYGVDGEFGKDLYSTATEDCTKGFAYLTAKLLDADYSLVSQSGYGIISGYTGTGEKNPERNMPAYYETQGCSYGHFADTIAPEGVAWDFSGFVPDTIVINLGTNDFSYCGADEERRREYIDGYKAFLQLVREKNPDAMIVCTLGIMGTELCDSMETAVKEYVAASGDGKIVSMRFDKQDEEADGLAIDWHPSARTHEKAAGTLAAFLRENCGY